MRDSAYDQAMERIQMWYLGNTLTTGLHLAAYFGVEGAVKAILHERVATDAKNEYGQPLLREARNEHEEVVKQLLEKGADLDKDEANTTVLDCMERDWPNFPVIQVLHSLPLRRFVGKAEY